MSKKGDGTVDNPYKTTAGVLSGIAELQARARRRDKLKAVIEDMVSKLLYYDRKEDEELPRGAIEEMFEKGEVTADEMVEWFAGPLRNYCRALPQPPTRLV